MFFFSVRFLFALAAKANSASYSQTSSFYCSLVAADLICTLTGPSVLMLLQAKSPSLSQSPGEQIFGTTSSCSATADAPTDPQQKLLSGRVHQNQNKGKLSLQSHFPVVLSNKILLKPDLMVVQHTSTSLQKLLKHFCLFWHKSLASFRQLLALWQKRWSRFPPTRHYHCTTVVYSIEKEY